MIEDHEEQFGNGKDIESDDVQSGDESVQTKDGETGKDDLFAGDVPKDKSIVLVGQNQSDESRINPIKQIDSEIVIVDDKEYRANDIKHLLNEELQKLSVEIRGDLHSFVSRSEALARMENIKDKPIIAFSDVFSHADISPADFARKLREAAKNIFIIMYSARASEVSKELPELSPDHPEKLVDVFLDRNGNYREGVNNALIKRLDLEVHDDGKGDEGTEDKGGIDVKHISTPESGLLRTVHTWVNDIEGEGKLGKRWPHVVGNPKERLHKSGRFLNHIVEEQMFSMSGKIPSVLIMGLGSNAIEAIYLAENYPTMKIKAIEIDPKMRTQGNNRILDAGVQDQIEIMDFKWQDLTNNLNETVDVVLSSGNEMDCLSSKADQQKVLRNVFEILNPGGCFAMDLRNDNSVKRAIQRIRAKGLSKMGHLGYPMYNGKAVIAYPLAHEEQDESRVWVNYAHTNPVLHEQEGDAVLTMLLSQLQDYMDMQNETGFNVIELYADFILKQQVRTDDTIITAPESAVRSISNFFEILSIKPDKSD